MPTASRNQRSCATRTTAASRSTSVCSSHSSDSMSRWLVGSSSSSTSAPVASARASDARVSCPPEKRVERAVEVGLGEPEPVGHGGGAVAPQVSAARLKARLGAGVAGQQRLVRLAGAHLPLELCELGLDRELLRASGEQVVAQRHRTLAGRALVVQGDPHALGDAQLAAVDRALAGQHAQQRRLAGAVAPGDRHAFPPLELEGDPAEQRLARHVLVNVRSYEKGHRMLMVGPGGRRSAPPGR